MSNVFSEILIRRFQGKYGGQVSEMFVWMIIYIENYQTSPRSIRKELKMVYLY